MSPVVSHTFVMLAIQYSGPDSFLYLNAELISYFNSFSIPPSGFVVMAMNSTSDGLVPPDNALYYPREFMKMNFSDCFDSTEKIIHSGVIKGARFFNSIT